MSEDTDENAQSVAISYTNSADEDAREYGDDETPEFLVGEYASAEPVVAPSVMPEMRMTYVVHTVPVEVKALPHYGDLPPLVQGTPGSSGIDLYSAQTEEFIHLNTVGAMAVIPTGISIALPVGFEAQIRPRSGLAAKHGISIVNTPGTIDADYRGEIFVILVNHSARRFRVERGMRIAQMVIQSVPKVQLHYVDDLDETERGEGRFGSTGA